MLSTFASFFILLLIFLMPANGSRYAPAGYWWAGRENAALLEPASSHANCLKNAQTPTGRVHAVLARFYYGKSPISKVKAVGMPYKRYFTPAKTSSLTSP